jgi:hypothetical protein
LLTETASLLHSHRVALMEWNAKMTVVFSLEGDEHE